MGLQVCGCPCKCKHARRHWTVSKDIKRHQFLGFLLVSTSKTYKILQGFPKKPYEGDTNLWSILRLGERRGKTLFTQQYCRSWGNLFEQKGSGNTWKSLRAWKIRLRLCAPGCATKSLISLARILQALGHDRTCTYESSPSYILLQFMLQPRFHLWRLATLAIALTHLTHNMHFLLINIALIFFVARVL